MRAKATQLVILSEAKDSMLEVAMTGLAKGFSLLTDEIVVVSIRHGGEAVPGERIP